MSSGGSLLGAGALALVLVACSHERREPVETCRCELTVPAWGRIEAEWEGPRALVEDLSGSGWYTAEFVPRDTFDGARSAAVLVDAWLDDDGIPAESMPDRVELDGRPAAVRALELSWAAVVPYDDGWVYLHAQGTHAAAHERAVALAKQTTRESGPPVPPLGWEVPAPAEDPLPAAWADLEVREGSPRLAEPEVEPPIGWGSTPYASEAGLLQAWAAPAVPERVPGPAVVWVPHDFGRPSRESFEAVHGLVDREIPVLLPTLRAAPPNPGKRALLGRAVRDLQAAVAHLRARADVDERRVYLVGSGRGSPWVLLAATVIDDLRAVVALEGPTDPDQDALRSPVRYAHQLRAPVWMMHGEFSDDVDHGWMLAEAARRAGTDVRWHLVPRAPAEGWPAVVLGLLPDRIYEDVDEVAALGLDADLAWRLAVQDWRRRWNVELAPHIRQDVAALHATGLLRRKRIVDVVTEHRGWVDARPVRTLASEHLRALGPASPSTGARAFRAALSALHHAEILVRPALPGETSHEELRVLAEQAGRAGFVALRGGGLLDAVEYGHALAFEYGGTQDTPEATRAIGERVAAALRAHGLTVSWDGDPTLAIMVQAGL